MRFDELTLGDPGEELRLRFHPELTILSGLAASDRRSLADSIIEAIGSRQGGPLTTDAAHWRSMMLLSGDALGTAAEVAREGEPSELREAREVLADLTAEVEAALDQQRTLDTVHAELDGLDHELAAARDGLERRKYASVLARLERVRAEAAAVQASSASIDGDRQLLAGADEARERAAVWSAAEARVRSLTALLERAEELEELGPAERERVAHIPEEPPTDLAALINRVRVAVAQRSGLDDRIRELSMAQLPAPSDPQVAQLGALEQRSLWEAADRVAAAASKVRDLHISLGGLSIEGLESRSEMLHDIEAAHSAAEAASRAAAQARPAALAGVTAGIVATGAGVTMVPLLIPAGIVVATVSLVIGLMRPAIRRVRATRAESLALSGVEAPSYLAFHLRRVEASIDPTMRTSCEEAVTEHHDALRDWEQMVGAGIDAGQVGALRAEIEAYNESLQGLGESAEEIEQLQTMLRTQVGPSLEAARAALTSSLEPYLLDDADCNDLGQLTDRVHQQCELGAAARSHGELDDAQSALDAATGGLEGALLDLGFDAGPLEARLGALEWAVTRAGERDTARRNARSAEEIQQDLDDLQAEVDRRRRPEWAAVTGDDSSAPSIEDLEARRSELLARVDDARPEVDLARLADRRAAVERRVAALEARHSGRDEPGQPGATAEIQGSILDHLRVAATAGPDGDPVPVVLDEVLQRVPADRKWDVLDVLRRVARDQQLIYLTEDAFVAAWAHQRALDGTITLLELAPEPVG